ncbi:MAG: Ldh family oxidoreductase [Spirochaetaceae bacterium]|jgi:LDH2 family malate/lactate/ureidoglycolate dehydrogenase|nr:Ldh family oxidoreductase [Spirochaetaceae bacterium]
MPSTTTSDYKTLSLAPLELFCGKLFQSYGFTETESKEISEIVLRADLYGIESHGIQRLIRYHQEIFSGAVDVHAKQEIIRETAISAVIDGHQAMGQLTAAYAMRLAIEKAQKSGIGMITVRNSNHYGIASYYALQAASADLIGISMTNSEALCVPTHGKRAMLGTNPIAVAAPAEPVPFSFDAASTVVPRGKLEVYKKNGKPLPAGWAIDTDGRPTEDAGAVLDAIINKLGGGIAPLGGTGEVNGGHKGYGFALIVDLCAGILSGGMTSNHINLQPGHIGICHFFTAIDYGMFGDKSEIKKRLSVFLQELRDSPKADGAARIYTHGEKEHEHFSNCMASGTISVNPKTVLELKEIAKEQGLDFNAA